jgi:hypothetical protein
VASLPNDQIADIMTFLGAPKDARYYKADQFGGMFDGGVDPTSGVVTLYYRVRFELHGARFGLSPTGTKEAAQENEEGMAKFKADFKRVVEETWSGKGSLKPACPVGQIKALQTKVIVTPVETGEHVVAYIHNEGAEGRSNAGPATRDAPGIMNLKPGDNDPHTSTKQVVDPTGKHPQTITTTQVTSAHEFGHTLDQDHPRCKHGDDNCYGVTAEERQGIMGGGSKLQKITVSGKVKDNFEPFERIAKRWGQDVFPGALAKCNEWSPG